MDVLEHSFEFDLGVSLGHFLEARFRGVIGIRVAKAPICATPVSQYERPGHPQRSLRSRSRPWPPAKFALIFRADTFERKILKLFVDSEIYQW